MIPTQIRRLGILLAVGLASSALGACSSDSPPGSPGSGGSASGGSSGHGSGGTTSSGGSSGSGGSTSSGGTTASSGGAPASGGSVGSGGSSSSGGSTGATGSGGGSGGTATGGVPATGSGGASEGGADGMPKGSGGAAGRGVGNGGRNGGGGRGGAGMSTGSGGTEMGSGGAGGGSSSPGTCQKGQTKGSDVAILGESFYAISPQYIENRIEDNARKAGSLGASEKYHNVAVSGQNMNYIATTEWTAATQGGMSPKWIIMDGGGIDCLNGSSCPTCASTFKTLLGKMGTAGVKEVIYSRYPEPGNPPGSNASLKSCLDATMPMMQTVCEGSTSPKCHMVDLRPVWVNGDTTDGLHPTQSGGNHVGDLLWSEMMKECFAQ